MALSTVRRRLTGNARSPCPKRLKAGRWVWKRFECVVPEKAFQREEPRGVWEWRMVGVCDFDKVVSAVDFIELNEQLYAIGDDNLLLAKKVFNMFDPGGDFRESFCRVHMRFCDDAKWRVAGEIELAFGMNVG